jgi:PEP-CTERM motif
MNILIKMALRAGLSALALGIAGSASAATVYDAFASFNGTQGAGNFSYGYSVGTTNTLFETNAGCPVPGTTCLKSTVNGDGNVPVALKSPTAFPFSTLAVPDDRLVLHPGPNSRVFLNFVAPVAGNYTFRSSFNIQDVAPTGVDIFEFGTLNSGSFDLYQTSLNGSAINVTFLDNFTMTAGQNFGWMIDNGGFYNNDSVGVNFTATLGAVPEPASWALMIAGFGLVGFAMRRRATTIGFA